MSRRHLQPRRGFTLVEILLTVGIAAVVLVAGFDLLWQVLGAKTKSLAVREVQQNARIALRRLEFEARSADDLKTGPGVSDFGVHPGKLTFDLPGDGTDVVLDTVVKTVAVGSTSVNIRKLRLTHGLETPVELTSDRVDVTNVVFTNLTHDATPETVNVDLTLEAVNPSGDANRRASFSLTTTITLRR